MKKSIICGSILLLFSQAVFAEFVTKDDVDNPSRVNFEYFPTYSFQPGPLQIGDTIGFDITVESTVNGTFFSNDTNWGLVDNGQWGTPMTYLAHGSSPGGFMIHFNDGAVSQVVAYMNQATAGADLIITAYDSNMIVLESYNVTSLANISTLHMTNQGAFRGIHRPTTDIAAFGIYGRNPVIDKLTFSHFDPDLIFADGFE